MAGPSPRHGLLLLIILLLASVAVACGAGGSAAGGPPQRRFPTRPPLVAPTATAVPVVATPTSPRSVVRGYIDAQGRAITLFYGRAVGRRGDWGWSHIVGKHLKGEWRDGGPLTTFAEIGVATPDAIQEIIGRSLQDPTPNSVANGRREYRLPLENTRFEMLTVVGSDGAIITAYPDTRRRPG